MAVVLSGRILAVARTQNTAPPENFFYISTLADVNLNYRLLIGRRRTLYPLHSVAYMTFMVRRATK
jgi:hypothetical protein